MQIVFKDRDTFDDILEGMLAELLKIGVCQDKKINDYEFNPSHVKDMVEQIREQMKNEILIRSGKGKAVSFCPKTYHITHALFSRSCAHYQEFRALSAFHYPSECSQKKIRSANKVSAG